jgi:predicted  nucleic acid-binding Zn-ribbon protein
MTETRTALKELQRLDRMITTEAATVAAYEPQLEEVEAPAAQLESEVTALRKRLQEITVEERRTELAVDEKRERLKKLEDRLTLVRTVREEAAVHAELDMIRRALEGDEQEALFLLDQIRRMEERLAEQELALQEATAEVEPRRMALLEERTAAEQGLARLRSERESFAETIGQRERRLYERIMAGGRDIAVADLTQDGACGNCFSVIPLQLQHEIRHTESMIRCEGCGVILMPPSDEPVTEAVPAAEQPETPAEELENVEVLSEASDDAEPGDEEE